MEHIKEILDDISCGRAGRREKVLSQMSEKDFWATDDGIRIFRRILSHNDNCCQICDSQENLHVHIEPANMRFHWDVVNYAIVLCSQCRSILN